MPWDSPAKSRVSLAEQRRAVRSVADGHPGDIRYQIAAALRQYPSRAAAPDRNLAALRALTSRFPREPLLRAVILRYDLLVPILRAKTGYLPAEIAPTTARLAAIEDDARAGEASDPSNAFFTAIRAAKALAARHDAEGFALLQRASLKPGWESYRNATAEAISAMDRKAFGHLPAKQRYFNLADETDSYWESLVGAARAALQVAEASEARGDYEAGIAVRHSLIALGCSAAVCGSDAEDQLAGTSMLWNGIRLPSPPLPPGAPRLSGRLLLDRDIAAYSAFLRAHGDPAELAWTNARAAECRRIRAAARVDRDAADLCHDLLEHDCLQIPERGLCLFVLLNLVHCVVALSVKPRPRRRRSAENLDANHRIARRATALLVLLQAALIWAAIDVYRDIVVASAGREFDASIGIRNVPEIIQIWIGMQLVLLFVLVPLLVLSQLGGAGRPATICESALSAWFSLQ